jgi:biotin operon repressor
MAEDLKYVDYSDNEIAAAGYSWLAGLQLRYLSGEVFLDSIQMEPTDRVQKLLQMVCKPCTLVFEGVQLDAEKTMAECGLESGHLHVVTIVIWSAQKARNSGYSAQQLRDAGYSARELRDAGYSLQQLRDGGFSVRDAGFGTRELRNAGYTLQQLIDVGFSARALRHAGYSWQQLKCAGFTLQQLRDGGLNPETSEVLARFCSS